MQIQNHKSQEPNKEITNLKSHSKQEPKPEFSNCIYLDLGSCILEFWISNISSLQAGCIYLDLGILDFEISPDASGGKDMPYKYPIQRSPGNAAGAEIIII
jgi:hypothetical protein